MNTFVAIILGIVQGLTEFLPVSSSGHLVIFQELFGMNELEQSHLLFDTLLHFGTLLSICLVYSKDIYHLIKEFFEMMADIPKGNININSSPYRRMVMLLITATIPAVIIGFLFKDAFETMFKSIRVVGFTLLFTGFLLWITSKLIPGSKDEKNVKYSNAFVIGLFQSLAITPGISRSGSTIVGALLNGLKKEFAVKFSFLMSIPAILGAAVLQVPDLMKQGFNSTDVFSYTAGTLAAAITGFIAIKFLINLLNRGKFYLFSYYCWTVGIFIIIYSLLK
ncbi:MAG: undecaprenyl-diphosphatase UppP [Clostridia bacterium]|jgi:undecaprenyl-diphosphatase|uniref:undecaprenyl-diphosphate phosphatase n=1 Tax=Petroclostridium xylanilyticum TaxID=1792311 RepID=UPI000B993CDE|nr:undecaprenyl-diphosphate phosphatase [Petroclostridium xylanilyticum]MBZ4646372.1 undecaprenyl-diphosphatase UppP [Clostridia bacterium]